MKNQFQLAALALLLSFILLPSTLLAQGSLTPPGTPAPTMKSLDQIEARTPISSVPFTITNSGSYYLTGNLSDGLVIVGINAITHQPIFSPSLTGTNAITITASGVTLDLNGFTINCSLGSTGAGIQFASGLSDITILNGHIRGGVTNNGNGVYGGKGFGYGIYYGNYSYNHPVNVLITRVSVSGCLYYGIYSGDSTVVESCIVRTVGDAGIVASTIKQSSATDCGNTAISGDQVSDCRGFCSGSGDGVFATFNALNCYGISFSGGGVATTTAENCYGESTSDTGLYASQIATGSFGQSNSGTGLWGYNVAIGCYGTSATGTGIRANILNSCVGTSYLFNYKYNMP
jgi:hypothetical protein